MKKMLLLFFLNVFLTGCSQTEKKLDVKGGYDISKYIAPEAKDITADNYVEKLNAQIKHFDTEPIYYFRINKQNCLIEVYVNDVREVRDYGISNNITPTEFGSILKSGTQRVTVKMYPLGNFNNESWGKTDARPMTHLTENSQVTISVISIDEKSGKKLDDEKLITKQLSPKDAAGKEEYEFSFTFDAEVPYEFEGWTKGQDLRKLNQNLVREKAEEFYKMVGQIHLNKDIDSRLKISYLSDKRIKSSFYRDKQNIEETLDEYKENVQGDDYTMEPIKGYKMVYMGDGKLLRLITLSQDPDLRGAGALLLKFGEDGIYQPGITLYLPEGRDLATQGFMMWK